MDVSAAPGVENCCTSIALIALKVALIVENF